MKTFITTIILILIKFVATGQNNDYIVGGNYYINVQNIPLDTVNTYLGKINQELKLNPIQYVDLNKVKIKFLGYKNQDEKDWGLFRVLPTNKELIRAFGNNKEKDKIKNILYQSVVDIRMDYFPKISSEYYNSFRGITAGAYSVPIRSRVSNDVYEFDANLSLGGNILFTWGSRKEKDKYIDLSLGISLTKVDANAQNSLLGQAQFDSINVLSPATLTSSIGIVLNLAKGVNIGGYMGWDKLSTADNKIRWIYNGKPWFGFGIGIAFKSKELKNDANQ